MSWNYRVVRKQDSCGNVSIGIHEAYYDTHDKVVSITQNPIQVVEFDDTDGNPVEDLHSQLLQMIVAVAQPIIPFESVGSNYAEGCGSLW